jgi:hypothetical protein
MEYIIIAVVIYLGTGFLFGLVALYQNLARFHGAGFMWKRMFKFVLLWTVAWPYGLLMA